jgi:hypothetical protein
MVGGMVYMVEHKQAGLEFKPQHCQKKEEEGVGVGEIPLNSNP